MGISTFSAVAMFCLLAAIGASESGVRTRCTLNNGRCTYRVQLYDSCQSNDDTVGYEPLGGSDQSRMIELEQKFTDSQTYYSKKLSDLATQLEELNTLMLPNDDANSYWRRAKAYSAPATHGAAEVPHIERDFYPGYAGANRPENGLLKRVHDEFSVIRADLDEALRRLAEKDLAAQLSLEELQKAKEDCTMTRVEEESMRRQVELAESDASRARDALADARVELDAATEKLSTNEVRLIQVEREREHLQTFVEEKLVENEDLAGQVEACTREVRDKNVVIYRHSDDLSDMRTELAKLRINAQSIAESRDLVRAELREVKASCENVTREHERALVELRDCEDRKYWRELYLPFVILNSSYTCTCVLQ